MGSDAEKASPKVTITPDDSSSKSSSDSAAAAGEEEGKGWESEAEALVANGAEDEQTEAEADALPAEGEPEVAGPGEGPAVEAEPAEATLVLGPKEVEEVVTGEEAEETPEDEEGEVEEAVEAEEAEPTEAEGGAPGEGPRGPRSRGRAPFKPTLPALLTDKEGNLNKRAAGALAVALLIILAGSAIYFILNNPRVLTLAEERFGDEVTYEVTGNFYFKYGDKISLPIADLEFDEGLIDFTGTLEFSTVKSDQQTLDGYQRSHTTFERRSHQTLDEISGTLYDGGSPGDVPRGLSLDSGSVDFINTTTHLSVKTTTQNKINYEYLSNSNWSSQEVITYLQSAPTDIIEFYQQLVQDGKLTEGDSGDLGGGVIWKVSRGEDILGHPTLRLNVHRAYEETLLDIKAEMDVSIWLSEASVYPLRVKLYLHIDIPNLEGVNRLVDIPDAIEPGFEGTLNYDAKATEIVEGTEQVPSYTPVLPPASLKHKLAQDQGHFLEWTSDGAPQLGPDLEGSGFDPNFDLQDAINYSKLEDPRLGDYLNRTLNKDIYVVKANYTEPRKGELDLLGKIQHWNFTLAYYDKNKDKVDGHWDLVNRTNGIPLVEGEDIKLTTPLLDKKEIDKPLSLRGMELVLLNNEHAKSWIKSSTNIDYAKVTLNITQNLITPTFDYTLLLEVLSGSKSVFDLADEIFGENEGYGYYISKEEPMARHYAGVKIGSGQLVFVVNAQQTFEF